jgi:hypothetical protein
MEEEWKRRVVLGDIPIREGKLGAYSISLYGPNLHHPTGSSDMAVTIKIYNRLMLVIKKVLADKKAARVDILSYLPTTQKMAKIYVHLFKRLLPEWQRVKDNLYVRKSCLV